jgi:ABC-type Fe3+-hydroxamate transport system substrate-binding protein
MRRIARAVFPLIAVVLAACSSSGDKAEPDPNIFPTNYKREVVDTMMTALDDPTNVRDAFISEPALVPVGKDQRYAVCVRYNARDLARRYVGSKDRIAFFFAGHLNQFVDATPAQCGKAAYKPFPEAEKICLADKCT